jgi:hypothetical protein
MSGGIGVYMKSNFEVVEVTDDFYVLFDNVTETELVFDYLYRFVKGAKVIEDTVIDYIADHSQVVECVEVICRFEYTTTFGDINEDHSI